MSAPLWTCCPGCGAVTRQTEAVRAASARPGCIACGSLMFWTRKPVVRVRARPTSACGDVAQEQLELVPGARSRARAKPELAGGTILWVDGTPPVRAGDRFEAFLGPPREPAPRTVRGALAGGGHFIACRRGPISPNEGRGRLRVFKFDPELHEVISCP